MRGLLGTTVDFVRAARGTVAVRLGRVSPRRWLTIGGCAAAVLLVGAATVWLINSVETTSYAGAESDHGDRVDPLRLDALSEDTEPEGSDAGTGADRGPDQSGSLPPGDEREAGDDGVSDSVDIGDTEALHAPDGRDTAIDGSAEATGSRRGSAADGSDASAGEDTDPSGSSGSDDSDAPGSTSPTTDSPPPTDGSGGSDGDGSEPPAGEEDEGDSSGLLDGLVGGLLGGATGLLTPG